MQEALVFVALQGDDMEGEGALKLHQLTVIVKEALCQIKSFLHFIPSLSEGYKPAGNVHIAWITLLRLRLCCPVSFNDYIFSQQLYYIYIPSALFQFYFPTVIWLCTTADIKASPCSIIPVFLVVNGC